MYRMRDGSEVQDPRLGRLPQHDPRSLAYDIRDALTTKQLLAPRSWTWGCPIRLDQGNVGSCVGNAVTHEAAARPKVVAGLTEVDALAVYHRAQELDEFAGTDYEGTSVLAGMKAGTERGWYIKYRWALNIDDLVAAIGWYGPAVLGINWYDGMMDVDPKGYVRPTGHLAGGHAILANGVNVTEHRVRLTNSWSRGWGWDGCAWLDIDDLARLLSEDGDAAIPQLRAIPQ